MHKFSVAFLTAGFAALWLLGGCAPEPPPSEKPVRNFGPVATARPEKATRAEKATPPAREMPAEQVEAPRKPQSEPVAIEADFPEEQPVGIETHEATDARSPARVIADPPAPRKRRPSGMGRTLGDLLRQPPDSESRFRADIPRRQLDDAKLATLGIRKLTGKRLVLYTDLPSSEEIDRLPGLFDQAFAQWCEYFGVDEAQWADWRMRGFLMDEKALFVRTGLLPADLPPFAHGYSRNDELWLYDQSSDYYRRHLLLHEGTHGWMNTILGGCGPPWYMEGIAEMLATHRFQDGRLTLGVVPVDRREVPYWGRIHIIQKAVAEDRALGLRQVIDYPPAAHLETEPYAWCWAAATLLDRHPHYRQRFRRLSQDVLRRDFTKRFLSAISQDWGRLRDEWQDFVAGLEYGYDVAATTIDFTPGGPLPPEGTTVNVTATRGWQNSGVQLLSGAVYQIEASGRYQVADRPQIWWCEPGGVSIRYYRGRPLGMLLGAVRADRPEKGHLSPLARPVPIGLGTMLTPEQTGTLMLKINDSAAELHDNAGELQVKITPASPEAAVEKTSPD